MHITSVIRVSNSWSKLIAKVEKKLYSIHNQFILFTFLVKNTRSLLTLQYLKEHYNLADELPWGSLLKPVDLLNLKRKPLINKLG